jgi:hypothetical protein
MGDLLLLLPFIGAGLVAMANLCAPLLIYCALQRPSRPHLRRGALGALVGYVVGAAFPWFVILVNFKPSSAPVGWPPDEVEQSLALFVGSVVGGLPAIAGAVGAYLGVVIGAIKAWRANRS